ncbi:MAG: DegT/DnrJ/EryC1/StrS family aminotransferase [bacterium]|nr:DegT/DnrJ/EryC1/StrS family aminotransferase [bacterium]
MKAFLSPPCLNCEAERVALAAALDSGYIAPCGPMVDAFEARAKERFGFSHALATNSGTMALELLARALNIQPGDEIIASTLTFIASVAPFVSLGAMPVFVDADATSWCMDVALAEKALREHPKAKALIVTDLYGQSCDIDALAALCAQYNVKFIVDAAESVGATYQQRASGKGAWATIYSFNGNKIITTGGGGLLLSDDGALVALCQQLASQGREPTLWYEHQRVGTHGRMGNIPAAIGLAQLEHLEDALCDKQRVWEEWHQALEGLPIDFMPIASYGMPNFWLTVITLPPSVDPIEMTKIFLQAGFEARPMWKPMHLQPVFKSAPVYLNGQSERLFKRGLCLPSGRKLTRALMDEMVCLLKEALV